MKTSAALEQMIDALDLPDEAYEKAKDRYEDLGSWFERSESKCSEHSPHIFAQGSFRLGTAIRPLRNEEEYDLDLACKLREGVTKATHTQERLKNLVGEDLEAYRRARGIQSDLEAKHRCWRLEYRDHMNFHMDIIPAIPEEETQRTSIKEAMVTDGQDHLLAAQAAELAVSITDDRKENYKSISNEWLKSNPEGYARWFESRMRLAQSYLVERAGMVKAAKIDDLQYYQWKTPLQRCIQLLKRHRDEMFKDNPDSKPISIIITTLAGRAYQGEVFIVDALERILGDMDQYIRSSKPRVPNPVNPAEDFADRWSMPECRHLQLEDNFRHWLGAARAAFEKIIQSDDASFVSKQAALNFSVNLDEVKLQKALGTGTAASIYTPKEHTISNSSKPWKGE